MEVVLESLKCEVIVVLTLCLSLNCEIDIVLCLTSSERLYLLERGVVYS